MRFRIEQEFAAEPSVVLGALVDPGYLEMLGELPDLGAPTIRRQEWSGDRTSVVQELVFSFQGSLPAAVTRVIDPARLSWVEHTEVDVAGGGGRFDMVPVHYERFFRCTGGWTLAALDGDGSATRRVIEGDLRVRSPVPFIGGQIERAIVNGLRDRLAHEPAVFARWLAARGGQG